MHGYDIFFLLVPVVVFAVMAVLEPVLVPKRFFPWPRTCSTQSNPQASLRLTVQGVMARSVLACRYCSSRCALYGTDGTGDHKRRIYASSTSITGDHIKWDLWYTQKPIYLPVFTNNIWTYLLWPPVIYFWRS